MTEINRERETTVYYESIITIKYICSLFYHFISTSASEPLTILKGHPHYTSKTQRWGMFRFRCGSISQPRCCWTPLQGWFGVWAACSRVTCSSGTWLMRPLTTVRISASPTSTSSTYSVSASGCFFAITIRPTRRSKRDTSTFASSLGRGAFFSCVAPEQPHGRFHPHN